MNSGTEVAWMVVILIVLPVAIGGLVSILARSRGAQHDEDPPPGDGRGSS